MSLHPCIIIQLTSSTKSDVINASQRQEGTLALLKKIKNIITFFTWKTLIEQCKNKLMIIKVVRI